MKKQDYKHQLKISDSIIERLRDNISTLIQHPESKEAFAIKLRFNKCKHRKSDGYFVDYSILPKDYFKNAPKTRFYINDIEILPSEKPSCKLNIEFEKYDSWLKDAKKMDRLKRAYEQLSIGEITLEEFIKEYNEK